MTVTDLIVVNDEKTCLQYMLSKGYANVSCHPNFTTPPPIYTICIEPFVCIVIMMSFDRDG